MLIKGDRPRGRLTNGSKCWNSCQLPFVPASCRPWRLIWMKPGMQAPPISWRWAAMRRKRERKRGGKSCLTQTGLSWKKKSFLMIVQIIGTKASDYRATKPSSFTAHLSGTKSNVALLKMFGNAVLFVQMFGCLRLLHPVFPALNLPLFLVLKHTISLKQSEWWWILIFISSARSLIMIFFKKTNTTLILKTLRLWLLVGWGVLDFCHPTQ